MAGHLGINVDTAHAVFYKGSMPLIDFVMEVTNTRKIQDLLKRGAGAISNRIQKDLKGVNVVTTHRGDLKQRFRIGKVSDKSCSQLTFDMDGRTISIAQYFEQQLNYKLKYPELPVVFKVSFVDLTK